MTMKKEKDAKKHKGSDQGRPKYHTGSTTQGGSNHGQGSMQLGADANKQGSEKNRGANYDNEQNLKPE
jgi:hypothetical protein